MFRTVRVRITALTVAIVVCLYAALSLGVYGIVRHVVYQAMDRQLMTQAGALKTRGIERGITELPAGTYGYASAGHGTPVTNATGPIRTDMERFLQQHPRRLVHTTWTGPGNVAYRVLMMREPTRGFVMLAVNVQKEAGVLGQLSSVLWIVGGIGIFVAAAAGFLLAERALRPVKTAWQRQLEFVADASHELRTPLSVVQSNLGLVMEHSDQTVLENLEWLDNAYSESRRMSKLVQDLLTLARGDAQALPIQKTTVSLSGVLQKVSELFQPVVMAKQQTLSCEISSGVEVLGDQDRLHQLFVILLDNASKYTPEGGKIYVTASRQRTQVLVEVRDTGVGIPKRDLQKVFQRFYQANTARRHGNVRGAGLGLAIAKWIVDAHGGRIEAQSEKGQGTTFRMTFPVK